MTTKNQGFGQRYSGEWHACSDQSLTIKQFVIVDVIDGVKLSPAISDINTPLICTKLLDLMHPKVSLIMTLA
ncbi:MAG TPA: hypothetical protein V6D25_04965 [Leptolyngbyaceae cyanobacterium]